jgi:hypothetical protein
MQRLYRILSLTAIVAAIYLGTRLAGYFFGFPTTRRHHLEAAWFLFLAAAWFTAYLRTKDTGAHESEALEHRRTGAILAVSITASLVLYWPAIAVGLLSDDYVLIERAAHGSAWSLTDTEFFRPTPLVIWKAALLTGAGAASLHVLNITLHGLNAFLVLLLARRAGLSEAGAAVTGAAFLVFPLNVEAVVWIAGLHDVLMTTGCLAFLLAILSNCGSRVVWTLALASLFLALSSKETGVVAPALGLLMFPFVGLERRRRTAVMIGVSAALTAAYTIWRLTQLPISADYSLPWTGYRAKEFIVRPFAALAVPWSTDILSATAWLGFMSAFFVFGILVAGAVLRSMPSSDFWKVNRFVIWVLVATAPVGGFFFVGPMLQGSRYLYLPAVGWSLLLTLVASDALGSSKRRERLRALLIGGILLTAIFGTRAHLRAWNEAAELRDRVLSDVKGVLETGTCAPPGLLVEGLPDSVRGAYVFRNGFPEALVHHGLASMNPSHSAAHCRYMWTDQGLQSIQ